VAPGGDRTTALFHAAPGHMLVPTHVRGDVVSTPTSRNHAGGATPVVPWLIVGVFALVFAAMGGSWLAAHLAAGAGFAVPGISEIPKALKENGISGLIGPAGSPLLFYLVLGGQAVLLIAVGTTVAVLIARYRRPKDGHRAMTSPKAFADLQIPAMAKRAQGLRRSLADTPVRQLTARQVGSVLGDVGGRLVLKSPEDVELVICGPRSNKTSAKVVPEILAAPGTVIATSNKPDVWVLTAELRAKVGKVFLFDPQHITYQPQTWWVNLLSAVKSVESAARVASYFMREVGGGSGGGQDRADPFFTPAAAKTLRQLLLAAACSGHTLRDVVLWVATRSEEPAKYLEQNGYKAQAASLRSTLELPAETRGGIYEGVSTAISCLDSEALLRWVTPPETWEEPPYESRATKGNISF
jgi:type IV secretion system protein VirD4